MMFWPSSANENSKRANIGTMYFKDISGKHKEFASNKVIDNEIAKLELERLLGRSRYAELVAAEKRMGASELSSSGIKLRVRN